MLPEILNSIDWLFCQICATSIGQQRSITAAFSQWDWLKATSTSDWLTRKSRPLGVHLLRAWHSRIPANAAHAKGCYFWPHLYRVKNVKVCYSVARKWPLVLTPYLPDYLSASLRYMYQCVFFTLLQSEPGMCLHLIQHAQGLCQRLR
jgi:hypothetical protein